MPKWLNRFQPLGILLLRLALGASMLYHGWPKVVPAGGFHHGNFFSGLNHFTQIVAKLGLPYWLGYISAFTEFVGGICLILGLFTRFFAFLITINMLVALFWVGIHRGYASAELPLTLLVVAIMLLVSGPGQAALDRKLGFN